MFGRKAHAKKVFKAKHGMGAKAVINMPPMPKQGRRLASLRMFPMAARQLSRGEVSV